MKRFIHQDWTSRCYYGPVDKEGDYFTSPFYINEKLHKRMLQTDHVVIWEEKKNDVHDEEEVSSKGIHFGTYGPDMGVPEFDCWTGVRLLAVIFIGPLYGPSLQITKGADIGEGV